MNRLVPFVLMVLAIALFFLYIDPTYTGTVKLARAQIAGDNQALAAASSFTAKENQLAAARDQIPTDDLDKVAELLPPSVNNVEAILDLNSLAARSGLTLTAIDVVDQTSENTAVVQSAQGVGSVDLALSATGNYQAFRTFLAGIEASERILDVESLSISGSASGVYGYSMTLRLYWLH